MDLVTFLLREAVAPQFAPGQAPEITDTLLSDTLEVLSQQRKNYSLEFFAKYPNSLFTPPIITHSISINRRGTGYVLLNAHSVVIFAQSGKVSRQFRFRAPRDRQNMFIRLVASPDAKVPAYLLDTRSGEIYAATKL